MYLVNILSFLIYLSLIFASPIPKGLVPLLDGRIVGGHDTTIEEFPHQISMRYLDSHRCGGAIINEKTIISAAHCVDGVVSQYVVIRAGTTECRKLGVDRQVSNIIMHEGYSRNTLDNDISMLILQDPLTFNPSIQPILLAEANYRAESGSAAFVSGWGMLHELGHAGNILQSVDVDIIEQKRCIQAYKRHTQITGNMMCAGADNGGKDACQGDSGGPLIVYSGNSHIAKLVGIVSWGYGCARPEYPGVYTRVSSFRNWIDDKLRRVKEYENIL